MDRLQYNILLEEVGIYEKRRIDKEEYFDKESDYIYKNTGDNSVFEIIPGDMTTEEIKIILLAKQIKTLNSLHSTVGFISVIIFIPFLLSIIYLIAIR